MLLRHGFFIKDDGPEHVGTRWVGHQQLGLPLFCERLQTLSRRLCARAVIGPGRGPKEPVSGGVRPRYLAGLQQLLPAVCWPAARHAQAHEVSVARFLLSTFWRTAGRREPRSWKAGWDLKEKP